MKNTHWVQETEDTVRKRFHYVVVCAGQRYWADELNVAVGSARDGFN